MPILEPREIRGELQKPASTAQMGHFGSTEGTLRDVLRVAVVTIGSQDKRELWRRSPLNLPAFHLNK